MSTASTLVAGSATLPLESTALCVTARGGIARVVLEQRFASAQNRFAEASSGQVRGGLAARAVLGRLRRPAP